MIRIELTIHDQEDAENVALSLAQFLQDFDEYLISPRVQSIVRSTKWEFEHAD